jgi:hypothetical protein
MTTFILPSESALKFTLMTDESTEDQALPWQRLYFFPLPQEHGSFLPISLFSEEAFEG